MKQNWRKRGLIYSCERFGTGFAADPFIETLSDDVWRIYYTTRKVDNTSLPFFIEVEAGNPSHIIEESEQPLLLPGRAGTFDDSGITITSIVTVGNKRYLYYCGWCRGDAVPYRLNIGLAISTDSGASFEKYSEAPILTWSRNDPIGVSAPCVIRDGDRFRMWYITFTDWSYYEGRIEPTFIIKHASSCDGISWETSAEKCIDSTFPGESFARPWVIKDGLTYRMWFSPRGPLGYRGKGGQHYYLDYAESPDGVHWERRPDLFDLSTSASGWDSEMIEYASVHQDRGKYFLLYNGNHFGKTGFGFAEEMSK